MVFILVQHNPYLYYPEIMWFRKGEQHYPPFSLVIATKLEGTKKHMVKKVILVDYENIKMIDLSSLKDDNVEIKIFLGCKQHKIPLELVQQTQSKGARVEWIPFSLAGKNVLDFFMMFSFGQLIGQYPEATEFVILTRDKGFDPVLIFLSVIKNIKCRRVEKIWGWSNMIFNDLYHLKMHHILLQFAESVQMV